MWSSTSPTRRSWRPTWAVTDDVLVTAFHPQTAMTAVAMPGGFVDSAAVRRLSDLAEGNTPMAVTYADLPTMTSHTYPSLLLVMQGGLGAGDLFGEYLRTRPPALVMPTLPDVMNHVSPAMSVAWVDDSGLHSRSTEPFPLSAVLVDYGKSYATVNQLMIQAGVLVPSMTRAREASQRVKEGSNLRQIAVGFVLYANEHDNRLPEDLEGFYTWQATTGVGLMPSTFISPRTGTRLPDAMPMAVEAQARWIAENGDVVYGGAGRKLTDIGPASQTPVAWTNPDWVNEGISIVFADGHVEWIAFPQAFDIIAKAPDQAE